MHSLLNADPPEPGKLHQHISLESGRIWSGQIQSPRATVIVALSRPTGTGPSAHSTAAAVTQDMVCITFESGSSETWNAPGSLVGVEGRGENQTLFLGPVSGEP